MWTTTSGVQSSPEIAQAAIEHTTLLLVLGVTGLLALAVLVVPLAARLKMPFTVMLAAVGIVLGVVSNAFLANPQVGFLAEFFAALHSMEITSEAVFFIFLPALVFESALSIDVRRLFDDLSPILMLAVLGLLISTAIVGLTMSSYTGVALLVCTLLGAIVSATDPVAVVAIFKDLGAPQRLAILVEGESLFNDATAIVAFTILSAMILGESDPTFMSGSIAFFKVFLGGVLVGYLAAHLCCFALARIGDSNLPKITLTISLAYLAFIIAEHTLHVSGVMAVVTAALVLGSTGRSVISQSTWHGLEEVWEQIGFIANSVIFVLVGLKVPSILAGMTPEHFMWLAVLLVAGFAARFVIIFGLIPALAAMRWSTNVSPAYRAVMFWGGLRGAVSLALALAVMENDAFAPEVQQFIGIMVTGFVLFTLLVNATTVQWVMRLAGLARLSPTDAAVRDRAFSVAMANVGERVRDTARAKHIGPEQTLKVVKPYEEMVARAAQWRDQDKIGQEEWMLIGLRMISMNENKAYHEMFDRGEISTEIARTLFRQGADLSDSLKHGGVEAYISNYRDKLSFHWQTRLAMFLQRKLGLPGFLAHQLSARFQVLEAECTVLGELRDQSLEQLKQMIGEPTAKKIDRILEVRDAETEQALMSLKVCYPDYAKALERRVLQQTAMRLEQSYYEQMLANSLIGREVSSKLLETMGERYQELQHKLTLDLGLEADALVAKMPFFENLDSATQQRIAKLLKPRLVLPDEVVFEKGGPPDAMYFVSSGAVRVQLDSQDVILGSGDFFGEMALLNDQPRVATVDSRGFSELLTLQRNDFQKLLNEDKELKQVIERVAQERTWENQNP